MPSPNSSMSSSSAAAKVDDPIAAATAGAQRRPNSRWPSAGSARFSCDPSFVRQRDPTLCRGRAAAKRCSPQIGRRHEKEGTVVRPRQARSRPDPDLRLNDRAGGTLWPSPSNSTF